MTIAVGANVYTTGAYSGTPITSAAQTTQASGSSFLMVCQGPASVAFAPSDSKSNAYSLVGMQQDDTTDGAAGAFYLCTNGTGGSSHAVSLSLGAVHGGLSFYAIEITGGATASIVDQFFGNTGLLGNPTSGPVTTTLAAELIISLLQCNAGAGPYTITPANSFTTLLNDTSSAVMTRVVSATGTYDPDPGFTPSGGRTSIITASFKAATSNSAVTAWWT